MSTPTTNTSMASSTAAGAKSSSNDADESSTSMMHDKIISLFSKIDPFLRFLTKATGKTSVPLKLLQQVLPKSNHDVSNTVSSSEDGSNGSASNAPKNRKQSTNTNTENDAKCNDNCNMNEMLLLELNYRGVLNYDSKKQTVGFPLPPSPSNSNDSSEGAPADHSTMTLPKPPSKMVGKGLHGSCK